MAFSAARFRPSRPNVERLRVSATGMPLEVAVPIIGPWISFIAAAIVVLATHPEQIWAVAILFLAIQQLENTLLVPKIQGDAVDMNPAVIMVLLVVGGALFGFLGIIVIVPFAAIVRDIFLYAYHRLSEEAEMPETPV